MKCQKCTKPATFHITDIERGKPREYHFCDEHARQHLTPVEEPSEPSSTMGELAAAPRPGGAGRARSRGVRVGLSREPSPADKQVCPNCNITFLEFRNS